MHIRGLETFDWIGGRREGCRLDLSRNELIEQNLPDIGVETSYAEFRKEKDPEGYFRETVAGLYGIEKEEVIPTVGGTEAIFLGAAYLGSISGRIAVPLPEYEPLFAVPEALGSRLILEREDDIVDSVSRNDSAMLTSPANPGGSDRKELFDALAQSTGNRSRLFIDETFTEFKFEKRPFTLFHEDDRAVTAGTMTKFFGMTNIRTGWIFARKDDHEKIIRFKHMTSAANPKYPLWLAANILNRRDSFAKVVRGILSENYPLADSLVQKFRYLRWKKPDSAPFGFVKYDMDIPSTELCGDIFKESGVLLVPGSFFGVEHGFRLCFFISPEDARDAFSALSSYFEMHFTS